MTVIHLSLFATVSKHLRCIIHMTHSTKTLTLLHLFASETLTCKCLSSHLLECLSLHVIFHDHLTRAVIYYLSMSKYVCRPYFNVKNVSSEQTNRLRAWVLAKPTVQQTALRSLFNLRTVVLHLKLK